MAELTKSSSLPLTKSGSGSLTRNLYKVESIRTSVNTLTDRKFVRDSEGKIGKLCAIYDETNPKDPYDIDTILEVLNGIRDDYRVEWNHPDFI